MPCPLTCFYQLEALLLWLNRKENTKDGVSRNNSLVRLDPFFEFLIGANTGMTGVALSANDNGADPFCPTCTGKHPLVSPSVLAN